VEAEVVHCQPDHTTPTSGRPKDPKRHRVLNLIAISGLLVGSLAHDLGEPLVIIQRP
jgi:hypothetical protein